MMMKEMEEEFQNIDSKRDWTRVFMNLQSNSPRLQSSESQKIENHDLNRYANVSPFDHSRIKLHRGTTDYINANLVEVSDASRKYILTQGPLPNTLGHFWLMIWEQKSRAILMLNGLTECGQVKCHQYWPKSVGSEVSPNLMKQVGLKATLTSEEPRGNFTIRKLLLTDLETNDSREILQFHYTDWPDFGIPESPASFLSFVTEVRDSGSLNLENYGPAVVHCSAGIGRSGTFCLVDSCLVMLQKHQDSAKVNVQEVLLEMRKYRSGLIQTRDQLRFAYQAIIQGAKGILSDDRNDHQNHDDFPVSNNIDSSLPRVKKAKKDESNSNQESNEVPSPDNLNPPNNNLTSATELRKRLREEKNRKMNEKIKNIKEKTKESESRLRTKNLLIKISIFSLGIIATAGLVYYYWPSSQSLVLTPSIETVKSTVRLHGEENLIQLIQENVSSLPNAPKSTGS